MKRINKEIVRNIKRAEVEKNEMDRIKSDNMNMVVEERISHQKEAAGAAAALTIIELYWHLKAIHLLMERYLAAASTISVIGTAKRSTHLAQLYHLVAK